MEIRTGDRQLMRDLNVAIVVHTLRKHQPVSRVELARLTRLGRSTISGIVQTLIDRGWVREVGTAPSAAGRKPVLLEMPPDGGYALTVKIGPGVLAVGLADLRGRIVQRERRALRGPLGPEEVVAQVKTWASELLHGLGSARSRVLAAGVALPGVVDPQQGTVTANALGWWEVEVQPLLETALGLPVFLENDANAFALGEWRHGAGQGMEGMVAVTIGAGIGSGIVSGGGLFRGVLGSAGELGHVNVQPGGLPCSCGRRGCLEAVAADGALAQAAREAIAKGRTTLIASLVEGSLGAVTRDVVVTAAREGDSLALELISTAARHIGVAVANMVNVLSPALVVVGGEATEQAGDLLLGPIRAAVAEAVLPGLSGRVRVVPATLPGDTAWLTGAAGLVLEEFFRPPLYRSDAGDPPRLALLVSGSDGE